MEKILSEEFINELHEKMFGDICIRAGEFRNTNKNNSVDKFVIGIVLKNLIDHCSYWNRIE